MGDLRFVPFYERIRDSDDPADEIHALSDEEVVSALAAASQARDPLLANVLATEAHNRIHLKKTVTDTAGEGIIALDMNGRPTFMNPAAEHLLGWKLEDIREERLHDVVDHRDAECGPVAGAECFLLAALREGTEVRGVPAVLTRVDGSRFPAEMTQSPILREGAPDGAVVVLKDVTDRKRAEKALHQSEDRLRRIMETSPVGITLVDRNGRITFANARAGDILGMQPEGITNLTYNAPVWQITDLDGRPLAEEEYPFRRVLAAGEPVYGLRHGIVRRDGEKRILKINGAPLAGANGNPDAIVFALEDVTAQVRAEEARAFLSALVESSGDAIIGKGLDGTIRSWNAGAELIYGYTAEETIGRCVTMLAPPEAQCDIEDVLAAIRRGEPQTRRSAVRVRKDGKRIRVAITVSPVRNEKGEIVAAATVARDVTEQTRTQEKLRESEAKYRLLAENTTDIIVRLDADGIVRFVSPASLTLVGRPPEEMIGKHFSPFIFHEDEPPLRQVLAQVIRDKRPRVIETRVSHASGSTVWVESTLRPVSNPRTGETEIITVVRDITKRKEAEKALQDSEEWLRTAFAHAAVGMAFAAPDGRILEANRAFCRTLGYTKGELKEKTFLEITHPEDRERNRQLIERLIRGKIPSFAIEKRYTRKDGRTVWVQNSVTFHQEPEGTPPRILAIVEDITKRKNAEARLQESEKRYRQLADNATDVIALLDPAGVLKFVSPASSRLTGRPPADLVGKKFTEFVDRQDRERLERGFDSTIRERKDSTLEGRFVHANGTRVWMEATLRPVENPETGEVEVTVVARDVTERKRSQDALRESEARLRQFAENLNVVFWMNTPDYSHILYVSPGYERIWGRSCQSLCENPQSWVQSIHPDDRDRVMEANDRMTRNGEAYQAEYRIFRPDGSMRWIRDHGNAIRDGNGRVYRIAGVAEDVTALKEAQEALAAEEKRFFESAPVGLYRTSPDGRILQANPTLARLMGYADTESYLKIRAQDVYVNPRDRERFVDSVARDGAIHGFEVQVRRRDGRPIWVRTTARSVQDADGNVRWYEGVVEDITRQREAEAALREREEHYRSIVEAADRVSVGIAIVSGHGDDRRITYLNEAGAAILGTRPETAIGKPSLDFIAPEEHARVRENRRNIDGGLAHPDFERTTLLRPDGRRVTVEMGVSTSLVEGLPRSVVIFRDVTEEQRVEAERERLALELEERVRQRTRALAAAKQELEAFTYSVSHDIRAPLRGIEALTRAVEEDEAGHMGADGVANLQRIRSESARLTRLVNDLLTLSRVTAADLTRERVDLAVLAREIRDELQLREPERRVAFHAPDHTPADADPHLLRIVLWNLLENAWKFTRDRPEPTVEFGADSRDGTPVYYVRDNGIGFTSEDTGRLFQAFSRLPGSNDFEGTGVGLATVKRIVERHGGRVWAEGKPDEGATLWFTLPGARHD